MLNAKVTEIQRLSAHRRDVVVVRPSTPPIETR
jgi:hypothetical protein